MSPDLADRLNEALEGRYRIEGEVGAGGMATVYLAEDLKHGRRVAVKVLRPELAAVVGAERFLAEIRTTANLQHPHILPLHDSGEADGFLFYVMPYVEGESLRERLERERQLPVEASLEITRKVAEALDYAHDQGIVHRDIKPANILLSGRGEPLVADFGIALAVAQAGGGRLTETGLSLGTPHYMSPEQAAGDRDVDPRSDVYSLGCVLYEMLAGEPPFAAATAQAVLARILTERARRVTELRETVPPHVSAALEKALEKLPADRFEDAAAFRRALEDPGYRYRATGEPVWSPGPGPEAPTSSRLRWTMVGAAVLGSIGLGVLGAGLLRGPEPVPGTEGGVVRVPLDAVEFRSASEQRGFDVSPDGSLIVFTRSREGPLEVLELDGPVRRTLPGTEGGFAPAFSPDGRWVVYSASGPELMRVGLAGGPPTVVSEVGARVSDWADDGTLYYSSGFTGWFRLREGEEPERVLDRSRGTGVRGIPGANAILFTETSFEEMTARIRVRDLESGEVRTLVEDAFDGRYAPTGHLLYARSDGSLLAAPFDVGSLEMEGPPRVVLDSVAVDPIGGTAAFALAPNGSAVYTRGPAFEGAEGRRVVFLHPRGEEGPESPPLRAGGLIGPRVSPDGRTLAYSRETGLYLYDLVTGRDEPLSDPDGGDAFTGAAIFPVWSPSGDRLAYRRVPSRDSVTTIIRSLDPPGEPQTLDVGYPSAHVTDWMPDGDRLLLFVAEGWFEDSDLAVVDLASGEVTPYLESRYSEMWGTISPDGRWVAYLSDESGQREVFVRAFPEPGPSVRVSAGEGLSASAPGWSPDGRTLYYTRGDSVYAAPVDGSGERFSADAPRPLLPLDTEDGRLYQMSVHPDGRLVFGLRPAAEASDDAPPPPRRSYLVVNWLREMLDRIEGPTP